MRVILIPLFILFTFVTANAEDTTLERYKKATCMVQTRFASGTGFLISPDGYVITNAHVVAGVPIGDSVLVYFNCGETTERKFNGEVIVKTKVELLNDFALLKIKPEGEMTFLELNQTDDVSETMDIICPGFPFGTKLNTDEKKIANITISTGKITAVRKQDNLSVQYQFDAALNHGNSGGPLIAKGNGKVIGVVNAMVEKGNSVIFALPTTSLVRFLGGSINDLQRNQKLKEELNGKLLREARENMDKQKEIYDQRIKDYAGASAYKFSVSYADGTTEKVKAVFQMDNTYSIVAGDGKTKSVEKNKILSVDKINVDESKSALATAKAAYELANRKYIATASIQKDTFEDPNEFINIDNGMVPYLNNSFKIVDSYLILGRTSAQICKEMRESSDKDDKAFGKIDDYREDRLKDNVILGHWRGNYSLFNVRSDNFWLSVTPGTKFYDCYFGATTVRLWDEQKNIWLEIPYRFSGNQITFRDDKIRLQFIMMPGAREGFIIPDRKSKPIAFYLVKEE